MFQFLRRLLTGNRNQSNSPKRMLQMFDRERQNLQQDFFHAAAASGKPRGLRWKNCDWLATYVLVNDEATGTLTLFRGVNVSFEAIEGGDMEGVEAVSMIRDGSAVFHAREGRWGTGGKVLFNVTPQTAATVAASGQSIVAASD